MRVYYNGPDALVTESLFVWRSNPLRSFVVTDLRNVRLVQRDVGSARTILILAASAAPILIAALAWFLLPNSAARLILLAAAVAAVALVALWRRSVHQWELRAVYRGHEVTLYTTREMRTFNQVTRALRRAVEASAVGRTLHRLEPA